ncbi:MAG TPA: hypothetical protein VJ546_01190 [Bacillales bacterium]|nr:hypothetical protein [Bacillales bacterium]
MENRLRQLLEILEKLNLKTNIATKGEINEQYDNLEDFKILSSELDKILSGFNNVDLDDSNKVEDMLLEFHRILTTFEWHFTEISDVNTKILKQYKDIINND